MQTPMIAVRISTDGGVLHWRGYLVAVLISLDSVGCGTLPGAMSVDVSLYKSRRGSDSNGGASRPWTPIYTEARSEGKQRFKASRQGGLDRAARCRREHSLSTRPCDVPQRPCESARARCAPALREEPGVKGTPYRGRKSAESQTVWTS